MGRPFAFNHEHHTCIAGLLQKHKVPQLVKQGMPRYKAWSPVYTDFKKAYPDYTCPRVAGLIDHWNLLTADNIVPSMSLGKGVVNTGQKTQSKPRGKPRVKQSAQPKANSQNPMISVILNSVISPLIAEPESTEHEEVLDESYHDIPCLHAPDLMVPDSAGAELPDLSDNVEHIDSCCFLTVASLIDNV